MITCAESRHLRCRSTIKLFCCHDQIKRIFGSDRKVDDLLRSKEFTHLFCRSTSWIDILSGASPSRVVHVEISDESDLTERPVHHNLFTSIYKLQSLVRIRCVAKRNKLIYTSDRNDFGNLNYVVRKHDYLIHHRSLLAAHNNPPPCLLLSSLLTTL